MSYFSKLLTARLKETNITQYRLHKLSGIPEPSVSRLVSGKKRPTDKILTTLAGIDELGISLAELKAHRALDDNDYETIKIAFELAEKERKASR